MNKLRVVVVADDPLARAGLAGLLVDMPNCDLVQQVSSGQLETVEGNTAVPDLFVWDVGWEPPAELPAWAEWDVPVIALLASEEDAAAIWATGVRALLPRIVDGERLATAVAAVHQGLLIIHPRFAEELLPESTTAPAPLREDLTPREREVLQLLAEGLANKAIARRLAISDHTVKFHVNAIMSKLGAQSRTEAVVRATRLGLILL